METSEVIRERVNKARNLQLERYKEDSIYNNSQLGPKHIKKYCISIGIGRSLEMLLANMFS